MSSVFSLPRPTGLIVAVTLSGVAAAISISGCGGGGAPGTVSTGPEQGFTVGGTVSGLAAGESLSIADNVTDTLKVAANGAFTFATAIGANGSYAITVTTAPPGQSCTLSNASGSIATANVTTVAVTCSNLPQYAYVVNNTDQTVSQYSIAATGSLTPLTPATITTGNSPRSVTIDPTHHYVYVANLNDNTISQYVIQTNGTLAPNSPATVTTGREPWVVSIDSLGKFAYVANSLDNNITQYSISSTGTLESLAVAPVATGAVPWNITLSPNGKFAYVSNYGTTFSGGTTVSQYAIAPDTGALSPLTPPTVPTGNFPGGDAVDSANAYAYITNVGDDTVSQFSIGAGGELTSLMPALVAAGSQPDFIAIDPSNKYAYVANFTASVNGQPALPGSVSQYTLGATGQLTPMATPTVAAGVGSGWLAFDPFGRFVYAVNSVDGTISDYSIGANGSLTPIDVVPAGKGAFEIATTYAAQ